MGWVIITVMKIERVPLILNSSRYSREHGVERSLGAHVSTVIELLKRVHQPGKSYGDGEFSEQDLERLRALGFIWERTMIEEDDERQRVFEAVLDPVEREARWEEAISAHAREVVSDPGLDFPGEGMYCDTCDMAILGNRKAARDHCKTRGHKGLFFTPDGIMIQPRYRYGVKEWKLTGRSAARTGVDHMNDIWEWPVQTMFYCDMYETNYTEIDAMFARGDYSTRKPQMFPYRFKIEYEERELHRNRVMLLSAARSEGLI